MPPSLPWRDARAGDLRPADVGRKVRLAGWVAAKRDHGGVLFVDLRDPAGARPAELAQLVCRPGLTAFGILGAARVESVVAISGTVRARPPDGVNPKLPTGEVEVDVEEAEVLSSAEVLPFPLDSDQEPNEESRLRYRYLDLRRPGMAARLAARAQLSTVVRNHLTSRGFLEVHTPVLTASSPEGARDFLVPSRLHPGEFYALPQAPQQFKQLLMVSGVERYFQIAPCFRDEASRADRSPGEFYQIDLEMAFATQEDVFTEVEALMVVAAGINPDKKVSAPFPRISFAEAVDSYGTDKPDLRFGLLVTDVTEALGGRTELPMFSQAPAAGHAIRALRAPGGASQPRRYYDALSEAAKQAGVIASWLIFSEDGTWRGPLAGKLTAEEIGTLGGGVGAEGGDSVLVCVGAGRAASSVLGAWRTGLGASLGLCDPSSLAFCWVVDFPMYERDPVSGAWDFSHNPFSMPQGGLSALESSDPGSILAEQYDLVCNGIELSSGAVRNHLPAVMEAAFAIAGYPSERVRSAFPALWNAFHYGAPPHAGIAPGFDRLLMMLTDQANLREVIPFPLNQSARDLLMGAPSEVTNAQLAELHLRVLPPRAD